MKHFESFLAPQLNEYLAYRQASGYATEPHRSCLLIFDRYLKEKKAHWNVLQPPFFLELRANLKMEPLSVNKVISTGRVFFQFLLRRGYYGENPLKDIPPLKEKTFIPFVFSPEQIDQLLGAVGKGLRKTELHFLTELALYLAILLMARCGMRISEPLALLQSHYRADDGTVYIEKTKFRKDRLIPVPKAVITEVENYLAVRKSLRPHDHNPYLLAGKEKGSLRDYQVRKLFHKAVKDIGLSQPRMIIGNMIFSSPTPHSLRHSFAVNTLKRIKERGISPQYALPILAAYMGHVHYRYTAKYLKVVDAASRQALVDFNMRFGRKP